MNSLFFVAILFFIALQASAADKINTPYEDMGILIQHHKGCLVGELEDYICGLPYIRSMLYENRYGDIGWMMYDTLVIKTKVVWAVLSKFGNYSELTVMEKARLLDDLAPLIWNKLYFYECKLLPQTVIKNLKWCLELLVDEASYLKQIEDYKLLDSLVHDTSERLQAYYLMKKSGSQSLKSEFFASLSRHYSNRTHNQHF